MPSNARQALLLRNNGEIMGWIRTGGVLSGITRSGGSLEKKIDDMFLAVLSRRPNGGERARYA